MKTSTPELSIIMPCYNEAENIPLIIKRLKEILNAGDEVEAVLVNNGSTDHSAQVFERELKSLAPGIIRVVEVPKNKGYGYGILYGLSQAKGSVLAWTHADMQTDLLDVLKAYEAYKKIRNPMTFVKGARQKRSFIPAFFTWGMGFIASLALQAKLKDIGAQPKLFSRIFYEKYMKDGPYDFSLDLFAQYWAKKEGNIVEVPVYFTKRIHGEAKGGGSLKSRLKLTFTVFKFIFQLRTRIRKRKKEH